MSRPKKQVEDAATDSSQTPLMKQYYAIKAQHPGAVLLFRVGDFYETFGEDAIRVSKALGIVLTRRSNGAASDVELAGFPHHSLDSYLPKLVRAGYRVAVCDQLEDPAQAKGIVRRGVTELVTPGVTFNDKVLEVNRHNYLASVHFATATDLGAAFVEVSTGDFFCFSGKARDVEKLLHTLSPAEVLVARPHLRAFHAAFGDRFYLTRQDEWVFQYDYAREKLLGLFKTNSLKGFGIEEDTLGTVAAGAIVHYLNENQQHNLGHLNRIYRFSDANNVSLDPFTVRNLELVQPLQPEGVALVDVLDHTATPMGARLLRSAILFPLKDLTQIQKRLDVVEELIKAPNEANRLVDHLKKLGDLERLAAKLATGRLAPREAGLLRDSLAHIPVILAELAIFPGGQAAQRVNRFEDVSPALAVLTHYLQDEVGTVAGEGSVIREGVSPELDEIRSLRANGQEKLLEMQQREIAQTGISSLKIGFNKVFGYYLEVTHAHAPKVPISWTRKQTLTNAERYITEELKAYEDKILHAEERMASIELELYQQCIQRLQSYIGLVLNTGREIAELDLLLCFRQTALKRRYVKPVVNDGDRIDIRQGRHPVIEVALLADSPYVPNDVLLDSETQQIIIITGPNMAGKSALLRQTALIVLLAQMGSFVPADSASIGLVDRIFTRVGASDSLSTGESTFMVEMNETAQIVNGATPKSLILLDEIGRGTSTYDGVSIAWALVEHLHEYPNCRAKTLFATHYHELNELESRLPRVKNFNVSVKEMDGKVLFLRTLKPGGSEHSFGIHVAEMAGLPGALTQRARELLTHFEAHKVSGKEAAKQVKFSSKQSMQLNMFELKDPHTLRIRQILSGVDVDRMTPVEALLKLQEIKQALVDEG
jgi:DNA mismatch repair protein MutS